MYYTKSRGLGYGSIYNIPTDAYGAVIRQSFPVVDANRKVTVQHVIYSLFVGERVDIDSYLSKRPKSEITVELAEYKNQGYTEAVVLKPETVYEKPKLFVNPIGPADAVFESKNKFDVAIEEINSTYQSLGISLSNGSQEQDKPLSY